MARLRVQAILLDLDTNGFQIVKEGLVAGLPTSPRRSQAGLLEQTNDAASAPPLKTVQTRLL